MDWYRNLVCASSFEGRGESDVPVDVDDDPDAKSPKGSSVFCGGEDGSLSLFYDMGPVVMGREVVEKGPPGVVVALSSFSFLFCPIVNNNKASSSSSFLSR